MTDVSMASLKEISPVFGAESKGISGSTMNLFSDVLEQIQPNNTKGEEMKTNEGQTEVAVSVMESAS